jgi:hypothetical protein
MKEPIASSCSTHTEPRYSPGICYAIAAVHNSDETGGLVDCVKDIRREAFKALLVLLVLRKVATKTRLIVDEFGNRFAKLEFFGGLLAAADEDSPRRRGRARFDWNPIAQRNTVGIDLS